MPNIREQVRIYKQATTMHPDAIVMECMALRPDLQYSEAVHIVKPNTVVITNLRSDHLDVMGPTVKDIAKHFLNALPKNATLFLGDDDIIKDSENILQRKNAEVHISDTERLPDHIITDFHYIEHKANVALALDVCKHFNVDENDALQAMRKATPDPGVLRKHTLMAAGKETTLINAMAANDPDSTYLIWQMVDKEYTEINIMINCRDDRIDRSFQMAKLLRERLQADHYILTGSGTEILARQLHKTFKSEQILDAGGKDPADAVEAITDFIADKSLIFAMGNTVGYGAELIEHFLLNERT
jgi:poly-gamma-glutamate synthase PgsB/CapB